MSEFASEFEGVGEAQASPDLLTEIVSTARELIAQQELVEQLEEELKAAKHTLHVLTTTKLPDLMATAQMQDTTVDGYKITVGDFFAGSLPKDEAKRKAAIGWLENNDGGGLIKSTLEIEFSKSQHNEAIDLQQQLIEKGYPAMLESGVHPQTLLAFVRERVANGSPIDLETLGIYSGRLAKAKQVKAKKGSR